MKKMMIVVVSMLLTGCEVCQECTTTYYDVNGNVATTTTDEVCGRSEIKQVEGTKYTTEQGTTTKTTTRCK